MSQANSVSQTMCVMRSIICFFFVSIGLVYIGLYTIGRLPGPLYGGSGNHSTDSVRAPRPFSGFLIAYEFSYPCSRIARAPVSLGE